MGKFSYNHIEIDTLDSVCILWYSMVVFIKQKDLRKLFVSSNRVTMSSLLADQGVVNPTEGFESENKLKKEVAATLGENKYDSPITL